MKKEYITPEFEYKYVEFIGDVLGTSTGGEISTPVIDDTLPRDDW